MHAHRSRPDLKSRINVNKLLPSLLLLLTSYLLGSLIAYHSARRELKRFPTEISRSAAPSSHYPDSHPGSQEQQGTSTAHMKSFPDLGQPNPRLLIDWNVWKGGLSVHPFDRSEEGGCVISPRIMRLLAINESERAQLNTAIAEVVDAIRSHSLPTALELESGYPVEELTKFSFSATANDPAPLGEPLKARFYSILGADRGAFLFQKVADAANSDPLLRGFGTLTLEVTFEAADDLGRIDFHELLRRPESGKVLSTRSDTSRGIPKRYESSFILEHK